MNLSKDRLYLNPSIYIARSGVHRWGVFTDKDIAKYDVIQESPYCTFPEDEIVDDSAEVLRYCYDSCDPIRTDDLILGFGFAAMFNHSTGASNAAYHLDTVNEVMRHFATEDIEAGEEIFLNYGAEDLFEDED